VTKPDLEEEATYISDAYQRLEEVKARARSAMGDVLDLGRGGTPQSRAERDVVVRTSLARLEALDVGDQALVFGRVDFGDETPDLGGSSFHIGRLSVSGEDMEPLVVDWRAPVAEAFYRATGKDPMGLWRRRHFLCEGRKLLSLEDELLRPDPQADEEDHHDGASIGPDVVDELGQVRGAGALFAAISRPRSAHMADIVATIQGEQDRVIRREMPGVTVVQGSPGTGKTAVALHRAAYLLYTHRWRFGHQGLLVVGPSPAFIRYISRVLPSLGESGVELHTVESVTGSVGRGVSEPASAKRSRLKGGEGMVALLAKAISDRERPLRKAVAVPFGSRFLVVTPKVTAQIVAAAQRRAGPHNPKRRLVEAKLAEILARSYVNDGDLVKDGDPGSNIIRLASLKEEMAATVLPGEGDRDVEAEVAETLRHSLDFQRVVERVWPRLTSFEFLHDLWTHRPLLNLAGGSLLSADELDTLFDESAPTLDEYQWSLEDVPLLDEARTLLDGDGELVTYGHMVIDEAQDLSPMAARMLAKRCPSGSMTVLGDLAQAFGPFVGRSWAEITAPLRNDRSFETVTLTVNYRTPAEIVQVADAVCQRYFPDGQISKAVRSGGDPVSYHEVERERLVGSVIAEVECSPLRLTPGTCCIVAPTTLCREIEETLKERCIELGAEYLRNVRVIDAASMRGLEFDHVVVVEPLQLLADPDLALRALYVALTRATQRVSMHASEKCPSWLVSSGVEIRNDRLSSDEAVINL
jgi:DNA helicase IV